MDEQERLEWFLRRIAEGTGAFKRDRLEHAYSVISEGVNLARAALRDTEAGNPDVEWDDRGFDPSED